MPFEDTSSLLVKRVSQLEEQRLKDGKRIDEQRSKDSKRIDKLEGKVHGVLNDHEHIKETIRDIKASQFEQLSQNTELLGKNREFMGTLRDAHQVLKRRDIINQFIRSIIVGGICIVLGWWFGGFMG